jgi:16S rRNA (adenine1518-N6/adenine1519-N6)-dimethyltransferase
VTSSVVRLVPRSTPETCDRRALEQVAAAAFGQRRKMLRSSLKSLHPDTSKLLDNLSIDANLRAEQLAVADFARIAAALEKET